MAMENEGIPVVVLVQAFLDRKPDVHNELMHGGFKPFSHDQHTLAFYARISNVSDMKLKERIQKLDGVKNVFIKDYCVSCKLPTEYDVSTPISKRMCYSEGNGQWCSACHSRNNPMPESSVY